MGDLQQNLRRSTAYRATTKVWRSRYGVLIRPVTTALAYLLVLRVTFGPVKIGFILNGAVIGTLYALVAFGIILVYRANRIINFAQAGLGVLPGLAAVLLDQQGVPWALCLALAVGGSVVVGVIVQRVILRTFFSGARLVLTVATIGVAQMMTLFEIYLPKWISGATITHGAVPTPLSGLKAKIGGFYLTGDDLLVVIVAVGIAVGLSLFFTRTRIGLAVRASAENSDRASMLGIPVATVATVVWVIAAVCSGLAVFLRAPLVGVPVGGALSATLLLFALAAAILARMESLPVAFGAGMAIGVLEQVSQVTTKKPDLALSLMLPIVLVGLLRRNGLGSRAFDTGLSSFRSLIEPRPVPHEMRGLPEVVWGRRALLALVAAVALLLPEIVGGTRVQVLTKLVVFAMIGVSLVVLSGWNGQVSLGQFGFAGVGAAVAGGLAANHGVDFVLCLVIAFLTGAATAVLLGIPALRIQGLFLAVVTLAFAATVQYLVLNPDYFGWLLPKEGHPVSRTMLFDRYDLTDEATYYRFSLLMLVVVVVLARRMRNSRSWRVFSAVRDNTRAAQSYGIGPTGTKLAAFAYSGGVAALAGALLTFQTGTVSSNAYPVSTSIDAFAAAVIGGLSSMTGALSGGFFYEGLKLIAPTTPLAQLDTIGLSAGVLFILTFLPSGIASGVFSLRERALRMIARRRGMVVPSLTEQRDSTEEVLDATPQGHTPKPRTIHEDSPTDALLVARGVSVAYDSVQVLFEVDMHVRRGEVLALLGTNGAGKSTLLKAISGLVKPVAGSVALDGDDITGVPAHRRVLSGVVQVPGGKGIFPTMTIAEHLTLAGWTVKDRARYDAARADVLARFPRLAERIDQLAGNLSGGEAQQLALGMAFIIEPQLLIIDELSLGLAPVIVEQLLGIVREINARGTSVVLVEQSINVALTVADRAYFMEKGEVRFSGPTAGLLEREDILRSVFLEGAAPATTRDRAPKEPAVPVEVLRTRELAVRFGGVKAVNGVDLHLDAGEILGLIGPNGAGKTTVFDLVSGFLKPTGGSVWLHGQDVTALTPQDRAMRGLGRCFQDARIFSTMTVSENIATALERHLPVRDHLACALGLPDVMAMEADVAWTVADLVELMNLGAYRNTFVRELSTGSRRVVDLAMALAHAPSVLVLDEPSSGIAQRETEALGPLLHRIRDETGCGMLVIEHDMPLLTGVSDRMMALVLGAVIAEGTPAEVVADPRVVASYLGSDEATINRSGGAPPKAPARRPSPRAAGLVGAGR